MPRFAVILPAAGQSSRFRDKEKKVFANLDGRAVWLRTAEQFVTRDDVAQTLVVVAPDDQEVFRRDWLVAAYAERARHGHVTDDAQLLEAAGQRVTLVTGSTTNVKITTRDDLFLAEAILKSRPKPKVKGPIHPFADEAQW